jgi:cyclopropane-fatty-acyl-phospholipid synthase
MKERLARAAVLAFASRMRNGQLTIREGANARVVGRGATPRATVEILSAQAWLKLLANGVDGSIDALCQGLWDSPDLASAFRIAARNATLPAWMWRCGVGARAGWRHLRAAVTGSGGSRDYLAAGENLTTEIFPLMLDSTMMYSCAVFERPESTLHDAQLCKLETICNKLALGSKDRVIEIGSGLGGFAIYAATTRGCHVTTTALDRDEQKLARLRVRDAGVQDLVDVRLVDYRDVAGQFDKLVALEVFNAERYRDFAAFLECCSRLLLPHGSMLLQARTAPDRAREVPERTQRFIRSHLFPKSYTPTPRTISNGIARRTDMRMVHLQDLTPHYAETLRRWGANVDTASAELARCGYNQRFRSLWRAYLACSEADFDERRVAVVQMVLAKPMFGVDRAFAGLAAVERTRSG